MKSRPILTCLLFSTLTLAQAAEPMNILGLPLGAKLKMPIRQCAPEEQNTEVTSLCWLRAPNLIDGGTRSGLMNVPGASQRPQWAAQRTLKVSIERDGTLTAFAFHTPHSDDFGDIVKSITESFGRPRRASSPDARIASAEWNWKDAHAELSCSSGTGCETAFTLADRGAGTQRYLDGPRNEVPLPASSKTR